MVVLITLSVYDPDKQALEESVSPMNCDHYAIEGSTAGSRKSWRSY